jgi:hypothetical protein
VLDKEGGETLKTPLMACVYSGAEVCCAWADGAKNEKNAEIDAFLRDLWVQPAGKASCQFSGLGV